jgi:hypothetical protein
MKRNNTDYNLEEDIRACAWMLKKVQDSETYAQNLYAAMCNNVFQRNEVWPRLRDEYWSCSWRSAGGIVAELRGQGDYIDWYCSGIFGAGETDSFQGYVSESTVTDEIRQDLFAIGWTVEPYPEDKKIQ